MRLINQTIMCMMSPQIQYKFVHRRQIMINGTKSFRLYQKRSSFSEAHTLNDLISAQNPLGSQPWQIGVESNTTLDHEIQMFKKEIQQRFHRSIPNNIYTFPKSRLSLNDILSSPQEQSASHDKPPKHNHQPKQMLLRQESRELIPNHVKKKKSKDLRSKERANSHSPLKFNHLRASSTFNKKERVATQKSISKGKAGGKSRETLCNVGKASQESAKARKAKQREQKEPTVHQFLSAIQAKCRKP